MTDDTEASEAAVVSAESDNFFAVALEEGCANSTNGSQHTPDPVDARVSFKEWADLVYMTEGTDTVDAPITKLEERIFNTPCEVTEDSVTSTNCDREHPAANDSSKITAAEIRRWSNTSSHAFEETLTSAAKDKVWRLLTTGSFTSRGITLSCWELLKVRHMHVGSLRLSLTDGRPTEHGLDLPDSGNNAEGVDPGVFRSEDEVSYHWHDRVEVVWQEVGGVCLCELHPGIKKNNKIKNKKIVKGKEMRRKM